MGGEGGGWVESWRWALRTPRVRLLRARGPQPAALAAPSQPATPAAVPRSHAKNVAREHGAGKTSRQTGSCKSPARQEVARRTCPWSAPRSHAKNVAREHGARKTSRHTGSCKSPARQEVARRTCPWVIRMGGGAAPLGPAVAGVRACVGGSGRQGVSGQQGHAAPGPQIAARSEPRAM